MLLNIVSTHQVNFVVRVVQLPFHLKQIERKQIKRFQLSLKGKKEVMIKYTLIVYIVKSYLKLRGNIETKNSVQGHVIKLTL